MKMHESATQHVVITCPYLQQGLCRAENYESCPEGELSNLPRDFGARTEKLRLWVMGDYVYMIMWWWWSCSSSRTCFGQEEQSWLFRTTRY